LQPRFGDSAASNPAGERPLLGGKLSFVQAVTQSWLATPAQSFDAMGCAEEVGLAVIQ
jgi:hypothetical protein